MGDSFTWVKMWLWGTWKGVGWSAIIYIAGISGIDQQLYEAAEIDGAGNVEYYSPRSSAYILCIAAYVYR